MTLTWLQAAAGQVGGWMYLIAGGLAFAEAALMVGMVFPGETALLVAGMAADRGAVGLLPMIAVAVFAAIAGDGVGYVVGRRYGPAIRASRVGRAVGERRWAQAEQYLHRHGGKAVLLGRFTAVLRALVPGMAGMVGMPYLRTFLPWNVVGGVVWGGGCVLLGYGFSASLSAVGQWLTWGPLVLIGLVVAGYVLLHRRRAAV